MRTPASRRDSSGLAAIGRAISRVVLTPPSAGRRRVLWLRFGAQLVVFLILALVTLAAAWLILHGPGWPIQLPSKATNTDLLDMVKIALSVVVGMGGIVALTVAYRKQHLGEAANRREDTKAFTERFGACATQLAADQPAVRLAGAYALAHLADDWDAGRQTCIDVLCAQLRMPYQPDAPEDTADRAAWQAHRELRHTIWRLIGNHLRPGATDVSWCGHDFDFTGAVIDGANLHGTHFSGGAVNFSYAKFTGGRVDFRNTKFTGGQVRFDEAEFTGGQVRFGEAEFSGSRMNFFGAEFSGGQVGFSGAEFSGGWVIFSAKLSNIAMDLSAGHKAEMDRLSAKMNLRSAKFTGGTVDISSPRTYRVPPVFDSWEAPPPGLLLPAETSE